jgi:hypothetical protein
MEGGAMTRLKAALALFPVVLLVGCQAGTDSPSRKDGQGWGGILRALRTDPIKLPDGTTLRLVLETALSSETSRSGDRVVARLAEDVRVGEKVVVPSGTEVRGLVTAAVPSGKVKGDARLAWDFDTLVLAGKEHPIGTRPVDITAPDRHKKDAAIIGIGAAGGGILGGILGGKKGAGIGVLIGGATGTGVVLTTKGQEVELATGTRVTVKLTREARL